MKKNLFYYLFAVICSVALFTSCSDDDDAADLGNSQRVEHVTQVQLVEILARNDVDLRVPVGIEVGQSKPNSTGSSIKSICSKR